MHHDLPDPPSAAADKGAWRRWARARRDTLAGADTARVVERRIAEHLRDWAPWRGARVALVYLAFGSELDPLAGGLRPGIEVVDPAAAALGRDGPALGHDGPALATTRTPPDGAELEVRALLPNALERHPLGFLQPRADAPTVALDRIDVVLVPGLCFDVRGVRLGYGRGYYDRLLPRLGACAETVGVVHDDLVVPALPHGPHDVPVRHLVGEGGLRAARP